MIFFCILYFGPPKTQYWLRPYMYTDMQEYRGMQNFFSELVFSKQKLLKYTLDFYQSCSVPLIVNSLHMHAAKSSLILSRNLLKSSWGPKIFLAPF